MRKTALLAALLLFAACGSDRPRRVDPADDDEIMGTGLESADIEAISDLAASLLASPALTGPQVQGVPTVAIFPVQNDTDLDFDAENLVRRIRVELVQKAYGRVEFVSRSQRDLALIEKERIEKREGEYTSSKQETKTGVDFYLTGTASSLSKAGRGQESRTLYIDFRLLDAETGAIVWEDEYVTKKVGEAGVIYR